MASNVRVMLDDAVPAEMVTVRICEPFQIYWGQKIFVGNETVELPADVAARHVLAGWCEPA